MLLHAFKRLLCVPGCEPDRPVADPASLRAAGYPAHLEHPPVHPPTPAPVRHTALSRQADTGLHSTVDAANSRQTRHLAVVFGVQMQMDFFKIILDF